MATLTTCDGCGATADIYERVGTIAPVDYCPRCADLWKAYVLAEHERRAQLVTQFELWRQTERQSLGLRSYPDA